MAIYNDCKITINLNKLIKTRPNGLILDDQHVDNIANDLRRRMTFLIVFSSKLMMQLPNMQRIVVLICQNQMIQVLLGFKYILKVIFRMNPDDNPFGENQLL